MNLGDRAVVYLVNFINTSLSLIGVHLSDNQVSDDALYLIYCILNIPNRTPNKHEQRILQDSLYKEAMSNLLKRSICSKDKIWKLKIDERKFKGLEESSSTS